MEEFCASSDAHVTSRGAHAFLGKKMAATFRNTSHGGKNSATNPAQLPTRAPTMAGRNPPPSSRCAAGISAQAAGLGVGVGVKVTTLRQKLAGRGLNVSPLGWTPFHGTGLGKNITFAFEDSPLPAAESAVSRIGALPAETMAALPGSLSAPSPASEESAAVPGSEPSSCVGRICQKTSPHRRKSAFTSEIAPTRRQAVCVPVPLAPAQSDARPEAKFSSGSAPGAPHAPGAFSPIAGRFPTGCHALCRRGRPASARHPEIKSSPETHRQ